MQIKTPHKHTHKNPKPKYSKFNPTIYKNDKIHDQVGFSQGKQGWLKA